MTNPFENADSPYVIVVNDVNQHSLWPQHLTVPAGWAVTYGPAARQDCLDYVDMNWTDLTPERI